MRLSTRACECMGEFVCECMGDFVCECMSEFVWKCMGEFVCEFMGEFANVRACVSVRVRMRINMWRVVCGVGRYLASSCVGAWRPAPPPRPPRDPPPTSPSLRNTRAANLSALPSASPTPHSPPPPPALQLIATRARGRNSRLLLYPDTP